MDAYDFNYMHAFGLFASCSKVGEVHETREFLLTNSKAPVAEFNFAYLKQPGHKLERALDRVQAFYHQARVPYRLSIGVDDPGVQAELLARGYVRARDLPCMVADAHLADAPAVPGLQIRRVRDLTALSDFQRVAFQSYGYVVGTAGAVLTAELIQLPHVATFVGYVDGEACACSQLVVTGDVAGIYWVGTLAAFRGRGLAAALTLHAAAYGFERGALRTCLQASAMGAPVYRRIGYRTARHYLQFDHA